MKKIILAAAFIALVLCSCSTSKNYNTSPCWKGKEPRYRHAFNS